MEPLLLRYREHRVDYPLSTFQSRILTFPDGIPFLLVLPSMYWEKLDLIVGAKIRSLEWIVNFSVELAHKDVRTRQSDFGVSFQDIFGYNITCLYNVYRKKKKNIANDFWSLD